MGKDLRDIIEAAESAISTYRRPNVDEARERITELLNAAGMGGIGQFDRIESISEEDGTLHISTSYVVRGCESGDSFELPSAVIDADDPVKAAREWGLGRRISLAEAEVAEARAVLDQREKKLAELRSADGVLVDGASAGGSAEGVPVVLRQHHPNCAYAALPDQPTNCSCPPRGVMGTFNDQGEKR